MSTMTKTDAIATRNARVRELIPAGATVHTILRHVSASGMLREISVVIIHNGELINVTGYVADILGLKTGKNGGMRVTGAGMDMGFHVVYSLATALYGDGYALDQRWL